MYVFGCKLSLFRLCDSDFGITAVDDITIGIACAAFCFHIAHISFASSWYLFCLLGIVLARFQFIVLRSLSKWDESVRE
jgi:predicted branched-subunit amino acid permease